MQCIKIKFQKKLIKTFTGAGGFTQKVIKCRKGVFTLRKRIALML